MGFKLVGNESFQVGKSKTVCVIKIEPVGGFTYQYTLEVGGKSFKKFIETQSKVMKTWIVPVDGTMYRVVVEMAGEFTDEGTETHFAIGAQPAFVRAVSSGKRREGIIHTLFIHDSEVPEYFE